MSDAHDFSSFPAQQQDPPGLTGDMHPRPDHGEDSYEGHGRPTGIRVNAVAPAFVFLASEREASYVSGTVLGVTGGKAVF